MTKKSTNRILRDGAKKDQDKFFKENRVFDELNEIHNKVGAQIQAFCAISALSGDPSLCSYLENHDEVIEKIRLLTIDLEKVIKDLNMNKDLHKDRSGGATNPDEHMEAITIFNNYLQITSVIEAVILPTSTSIIEKFAVAETKRNEANKDKSIETTNSEPSVDSETVTPLIQG